MAAIQKLKVRITKCLMSMYGGIYMHVYTKYEVSKSNSVCTMDKALWSVNQMSQKRYLSD